MGASLDEKQIKELEEKIKTMEENERKNIHEFYKYFIGKMIKCFFTTIGFIVCSLIIGVSIYLSVYSYNLYNYTHNVKFEITDINNNNTEGGDINVEKGKGCR